MLPHLYLRFDKGNLPWWNGGKYVYFHFLDGFNRFVSHRGVCHAIYSNNAKTFRCADQQLLAYWFENRACLADQGIVWRFMVEVAPWVSMMVVRILGTDGGFS